MEIVKVSLGGSGEIYVWPFRIVWWSWQEVGIQLRFFGTVLGKVEDWQVAQAKKQHRFVYQRKSGKPKWISVFVNLHPFRDKHLKLMRLALL